MLFNEKALTKVRVFLFACIVGGLSGCATYLLDPADLINSIALENGWREIRFSNDNFMIAGFHRPLSNRVSSATIYIEGDGFPWKNRTQPSDDPTPLDPIALKLAIRDTSANTLYLARPCQLTRGDERRGCDHRFWTNARFHEDVVDAMNQAISAFANKLKLTELSLVGYSGGGAVAALIAARRMDVSKLITVAGTLDHKVWTEHHQVSPLHNSLNPKDFAQSMRQIEQFHIVGTEDKIMPERIAKSFVSGLGNGGRAHIISVPGADHACCWVEKWPELLALTAQP